MHPTPGHPNSTVSVARKKNAGFSLVETVLAIGIVAFAFLPLFGLLSTGLNVFRAGLADTVHAQIAQHLVSECQQTDFTTLENYLPPKQPLPIRYFDNDGVEVPTAASATSIYTARVNILPQTALKERSEPNLMNLLSVQVQIATNPGAPSDPFSATSHATVVSYVAFVARNSGVPPPQPTP